jgi:hypothetical protein
VLSIDKDASQKSERTSSCGLDICDLDAHKTVTVANLKVPARFAHWDIAADERFLSIIIVIVVVVIMNLNIAIRVGMPCDANEGT